MRAFGERADEVQYKGPNFFEERVKRARVKRVARRRTHPPRQINPQTMGSDILPVAKPPEWLANKPMPKTPGKSSYLKGYKTA